MPQVFNIPKVEHDQPCSTLVVLFFKISLFIYVILGNGPISAKNNVNKQTNFEKQNNQSWAWLIMLNFGNVKNLGHKELEYVLVTYLTKSRTILFFPQYCFSNFLYVDIFTGLFPIILVYLVCIIRRAQLALDFWLSWAE